MCVNLNSSCSWPAVLNVSKRSQMMRHFHKDLFSKIYYSPMQLHIASKCAQEILVINQIGDSLLNKFCIAFLVLFNGNWAIGIFSVNQKVLRHIITKTCNKITKTSPCNIQRTFLAHKKIKISLAKFG